MQIPAISHVTAWQEVAAELGIEEAQAEAQALGKAVGVA